MGEEDLADGRGRDGRHRSERAAGASATSSLGPPASPATAASSAPTDSPGASGFRDPEKYDASAATPHAITANMNAADSPSAKGPAISWGKNERPVRKAA